MNGLDLAKNNLQLRECKKISAQINCSTQELEKILREKISGGIFIAWQIQNVIRGKFDGKKLLLEENLPPNFDDWLECRIFNEREEIHLKRSGNIFSGRYVRDEDGTGNFYVDSFAQLLDENFGLTTRNYIDSDAATGLSGYVDYRFVAIDSVKDGD